MTDASDADAISGTRLVTARCELVPVSVDIAYKIMSGDCRDLNPGEGWPHENTAAAASRVVSTAPAAMWLVTVEGRAVGDCGTHGPPDASGTVEIGYGFAPTFRGKGYGTEAVAALRGWLMGRPGTRRVIARTDADNVASRRVLEKVGFRFVAASNGEFTYEWPSS